MIYIVCGGPGCGLALRMKPPEEVGDFDAGILIGQRSEWYPDMYPCPACGAAARVALSVPKGAPVRDVTLHEAFVAFSGAGMPEEHECSATAVKQMLAEHGVADVETKHIAGTSRCTIERIVLKNGWVLHLGASVHGACVYRVQKEPNYATAALQSHHA